MNGWLIDTNVLSEFAREDGADPAVMRWLGFADENSLFVIVLALAELRRGMEAMSPGRRRRQLEQWFETELLPAFEGRTLDISRSIADRWAISSAALEKKGKTQPVFDGLMAVTALEYNLTVVTRNVSDFVEFQVPIVNPWE